MMIFGRIQEPCWTLNQAIFLKNSPSHTIIKSERCDACIPALNYIKKSIPNAYMIFRRSGKCMRNKYWTNLDKTK